MKIDIHTHTKKIKQGDAETRNIQTEKFIEIIKSTEVKILAITNHNHCDKQQFLSFSEGVKEHCQIWPGIELDVIENNKRAHLIVICNPNNYQKFDHILSNILKGQNPDTFAISIQDVVDNFDPLDCIYIAHYFAKKPNLGDEEINKLQELVSNRKRVLKEATNSISAGIYISHGHNSIYGSDVQNWDNYIKDSVNLPDLRLPVESFEQFCLLLEKDESTINTILNKKIKENIQISPFSLAELISLDIYNDINIIFGSKGTGKTEILESLSKYFNEKGYKTSVYKSNNNHLDDVFDIKGNKISCKVEELGIENCENEIKFLKEVSEKEVTSLTKYMQHYSFQETNRISQNLKIKNIEIQDAKEAEGSGEEIFAFLNYFKNIKKYVIENLSLKKYIDKKLLDTFVQNITSIMLQLRNNMESQYFEYKSITLLNQIITVFLTEISKKTGIPQKPTSTGFLEYARNRIKIEYSTNTIIRNISIQIQPKIEYIGSLGEKGDLYCQTNLKIQNGTINDSSYTPTQNVRKNSQKDFVKSINSIKKNLYTNDLFSKINSLNEIEDIKNIKSLNDLLLKNRHFLLKGEIYSPSTGESSMILLHKELSEEKDIYLIDEPEKSLGNDYINDVIVPLIQEKALLGKKVIIATHDANIAVRTLPYNSIYRLHEGGQYFTMVGNPFTNKLKCIYDSRKEMDWKEISMKTLEGGRNAFGERGKIYGN